MAGNRKRILVINPNSNEAVTQGLSDALEPFRLADGPEIECHTLAGGPFGIESQKDFEAVSLPLRALVEERDDADAFILACYSDPGIHVCREATDKPVFGIQACAAMTALAMTDRFGVLALGNKSIQRHYRYLRQMGIGRDSVIERPMDMTVAESAGGKESLGRLIEVARVLRDEDGAGVIILGCTGMARHREAVQDALGLAVIDPTQAAVAMAMGAVLSGRSRARRSNR